jgi:hypothetical protein
MFFSGYARAAYSLFMPVVAVMLPASRHLNAADLSAVVNQRRFLGHAASQEGRD